MSVTFYTDQPKQLLKAFDDSIKQTAAKGKITTWEKLPDDIHYTHKAADWHREAFFKAVIKDDKLVFNIVKPKGATVSTTAYAYYHGHLIETFLNHFDLQFTEGSASESPRISRRLQLLRRWSYEQVEEVLT